jgi:sulfate adenylyltransferase subunit 2
LANESLNRPRESGCLNAQQDPSLEAESIHIMREVAAEFEKPGDAVFDRQGFRGDAASGAKAFYPSPPPFPLLHVDTDWKFREMIAFATAPAEGWASN